MKLLGCASTSIRAFVVATVFLFSTVTSIHFAQVDASSNSVRQYRTRAAQNVSSTGAFDVDGIETSFHHSFNYNDRETRSVHSSISVLFEECSSSCNAPHERRTTSSCCRGGVSSLKLIYHGPNGSLLVPGDPSLNSLIKIDPCNDYRRLTSSADNAPDSIRFASCDRCFPASNDDCDVDLDVATVQDVSSGDMICLVRVDEESDDILPRAKFPSILDLYFVAPEDDDVVEATSIRTSCSSTIYAPFGVRVGECNDNADFYVDMSTTSLADGESVLEFADGSSTCNPGTSFSDCFATTPSSPSPPSVDGACCEGGASFIKVRLLGGKDIAGFLTIDSEMVASSVHCDDNDFGSSDRGNSGTTVSSSHVRFIDCNDKCLLQGFDVDCVTAKTSIDGIGTGEEFCIVSFYEGIVSFAEKLPTSFGVWFIPESNAMVHSLLIHSSCSKPFLGYGQTFGFECDASDSIRVDISQKQPDEDVIFVEFVDGFSAGYFNALQRLDWSASTFDISFSGCGCACEQPGAPSPPSGDAPFLLTVGPSGFSSTPSRFSNNKTSTSPSEPSGSTPFGSIPSHGNKSASPVAKAVTPSALLERTSDRPSLMPPAKNGATGSSPSYEPTNPRRPRPGRGKKASTPNESFELPSRHPSLMPSTKKGASSKSPSFEPTSPRRPGPGRGKKATTPSESLERLSHRPSLMLSAKNGIPATSPSYEPAGKRRPETGRGKKVMQPNESAESPSSHPSLTPLAKKSVTSTSPSYEPTSPRGAGRGKKGTSPSESGARRSSRPSLTASAKNGATSTSPAYEPTSPRRPGPGRGKKATTPSESGAHRSGRPSVKPSALSVPFPCPTKTPPPHEVDSLNPSSAEPTWPGPGMTASPNALQPTSTSNPANTPNPGQTRTSFPADATSVRPTSPRSIEPTIPRNPGPRPAPAETFSPNVSRPPRPSKTTNSPDRTSFPTDVISSYPVSPTSIEPTTSRNPGPRPGPAMTRPPKSSRPSRPSNSTNTPSPVQAGSLSPADVRPTSLPSLEPTTRRNPGPRPGPAETSSPNASRPPRPSRSTNPPDPAQIRTSFPTNVSSAHTSSPPSIEPSTPHNPGPRPGPAMTRSPNALRPPRPSNSTNTPSAVQAGSLSPADVRPTSLPSLEPTTRRNPGPRPGPAETSSPNASRPSSPSKSTNPSDPVQIRTSFPTVVRTTSPPSVEPTSPRNPGPRPGPGETSSPNALLPFRPTKPSVEPTPLFSLDPAVTRMPSLLAGPIDCNILCEQWVLENCVVVGDDGAPLPGFPCDVSSSIDVNGGRHLGTVDEAIIFHENMITVYSHMLLSIQVRTT